MFVCFCILVNALHLWQRGQENTFALILMVGNPIAVTTTQQLFNTGLYNSEYINI